MTGAAIGFVLFIIAVALVFDFINGFHDAANSIATVVSTRVLSPRLAVLWTAVFNFIAFLVFGGKKLPELGAGLGKGIASFKKGLKEPEQLDDKTV